MPGHSAAGRTPGCDNLNGTPAAPADPSFIGSMAHAAVFDHPLTAAEVMAQYGAGT
ncbi:hypothetical protein [Klenkia brasiliensis]|uniref:hypothetical protein n=1 Tax=Klenkia brasiliensis TaxID=333142 RepID=UPI0013F64885|nr:hypothetical protein [Klenkia brasiliensis]